MKPKSTACILCSINCGILINQDEAGNFTKIVGDPDHPISEGYLCQKATRLNYYQKQARLTSPLKKHADGSFEEISWDQAIAEIAEKLVQLRSTHGGRSIGYVGGGGQGNHLGGIFANSFRGECETPYIYSALAQEKTGNFWVNGRLFGRQSCHYTEPVDAAEYVMIIGANPLQSHGIPKARPTINEVSRNKAKTLVVVDPRLSETAKKADIFMQVIPGKDAFLLSAILAVIMQEGLEDQSFIQNKTTGFEKIKPHFLSIPIGEYAKISGVSEEQIRTVAQGIAAAKTFALRSDLGIEQSENSTLNAYLVRLLFLVTGNFGKAGTNNLHSAFIQLISHSKEPEEGGVVTQVTGMKGIAKLFPPSVLPLEINTDHEKRLRAVVVDSSNPITNYPDTHAHTEAFKKLELLVTIDVAMTETAKISDYVLPAASQFEKVESTFFNMEFPENFYHLRHPLSEPLNGTLDEPEIYHRLSHAMGGIPRSFPLLEKIAKLDRRIPGLRLFQIALATTLKLNPKWKKHTPFILKETLGKALPFQYAKSAGIIWGAAHQYANRYPKAVKRIGLKGEGYALGEALFNKILNSKSGTLISKHTYEEGWDMIKHKDKKVHLEIEEMLDWLDKLPQKLETNKKQKEAYPFNLMAGERRPYNANAIIRNPEWRKKDIESTLKIHPTDALTIQVEDGDYIKCTSEAGSIRIKAQLSVEMPKGTLSMPHGYGFSYPGEEDTDRIGVTPNLLTSLKDCDPLAKTPYHKNVQVKIEKTH